MSRPRTRPDPTTATHRRDGWSHYASTTARAPDAHQQAAVQLPRALAAALEDLGPELLEDLAWVGLRFESLGGHSFTVRLRREGR